SIRRSCDALPHCNRSCGTTAGQRRSKVRRPRRDDDGRAARQCGARHRGPGGHLGGHADARPRRRRLDPRSASGLTTIQYVVATAMSLVVFVALANAIVDLYARGVARAAVDEGARAGAVMDATVDDCAARANRVLEGAVPRGSVRVTCSE